MLSVLAGLALFALVLACRRSPNSDSRVAAKVLGAALLAVMAVLVGQCMRSGHR